MGVQRVHGLWRLAIGVCLVLLATMSVYAQNPGAAAPAPVVTLVTADPPQGAKVTYRSAGASSGWNAPPLAPWLEAAVQKASKATFGR